MAVVAVKIISGTAFDIYALEVNDRCEMLEFLNELEVTKPQEFNRLVRVFDWTAKTGLLKDPKKFKFLRDKIYEFKTSGGVRVACFLDEGCLVVLTNGFNKPKNYADDIERAIRFKNLYEQSKSNDCLTYKDNSKTP